MKNLIMVLQKRRIMLLKEANKDIVLADSPEPTEYEEYLPNAKHICIKSGTYAEMQANKGDFLPKELLWCYDTQTLWIKDPKTYKLIKIGSTGGGEEPRTWTRPRNNGWNINRSHWKW